MALFKRMVSCLQNDRGAALITVMLVVSVMSAGAVVSFERLDFSIRRTGRVETLSQARHYAFGGEEMARAYATQIVESKLLSREFARSGGQHTLRYPIEGGTITGVLADSSNCFNINSLAEQVDSESTLMPAPERYEALLVALGIGAGQAHHLSATLTDWLDGDTRPVAGGAEDYDYSVLAVPYRTANSPIVDIGELAFVKGYTIEILERLMPYVCARPDTDAAILHVNSLRPAEAPLLVSLLGGDITVYDAALLISERPAGGYTSVADFWKQRAFKDKVLSQEVRQLVDIVPEAFTANIDVAYHGVHAKTTALITVADGKSRTTARWYGGRL